MPAELLHTREEITISIDGLVVNSLIFLNTISHDLYYRTGQYIVEAKATNYEEYLTQLYTLYKKTGLILVEIHCDNEFHKAMDNFLTAQDPIIKINYPNT